MKRRTVIVEGPLGYRMRRYTAARYNEIGLDILTLPRLAARLAGGFARPVDGAALFAAIDAALKLDGYGELDAVRRRPGMARAVSATLTSAWLAGVPLESVAPRNGRLDALALVQGRVIERLPPGMMPPPALCAAALERIELSERLLGDVVLDGLVQIAPVWRPLISALAERTDVEWRVPAAGEAEWFAGRVVLQAAKVADSPIGYLCSDPRSEVLEALRWSRELLARGDVSASQIAIASASPGPWDAHFVSLAREAGLPLHFSHGVPALESASGQACAALAHVLADGVNQERVRRLLRRLPATPMLAAVPPLWSKGLSRDASLRTLAEWRKAFQVARRSAPDAAQAEAAVIPIVELLEAGTEGAVQAGRRLLAGESLALWDQALQTAPPAAVALTLQSLRVPDERDPANSVVWCPASHLAACPRPYVTLIGLSGRSWPRTDATDPLLPRHVLPQHVLAAASMADQDRRHFSVIRDTAAHLALSRSLRSAEGGLLPPSPLWPGGLQAEMRSKTRVPEHAFSETDRLLARPAEAGQSDRLRTATESWRNRRSPQWTEHDGRITADHPVVRRALERLHSTTSLRCLLRDPLAFVWRYALGWRAVPSLQQPLSLAYGEFGELNHDILRHAVLSLDPTPGLSAASPEQIAAAVAAATETAGRAWQDERRVPPPVLWRHTLEEAARRCSRALLVDRPLRSDTRSWTEISFGATEGDRTEIPWDVRAEVRIGDEGPRFAGRIDRIDVAAGGGAVRISDYKTRSAPKNADQLVLGQGRELQRALYAIAVRQLLPDASIVARLVYLDDESDPIVVKGAELANAAETLTKFVAAAMNSLGAGNAAPGPDAWEKWNGMRLAYPVDLDAYRGRKSPAFDQALREISPLWSER